MTLSKLELMIQEFRQAIKKTWEIFFFYSKLIWDLCLKCAFLLFKYLSVDTSHVKSDFTFLPGAALISKHANINPTAMTPRHFQWVCASVLLKNIWFHSKFMSFKAVFNVSTSGGGFLGVCGRGVGLGGGGGLP